MHHSPIDSFIDACSWLVKMDNGAIQSQGTVQDLRRRNQGTYAMIHEAYALRCIIACGHVANSRVQIVGSFAQAHCFPRAVAYLDSGKIKVKGMVSLHFWQLTSLAARNAHAILAR